MRARPAVPAAVVASGAATVAYASLVERTAWTLRRFDVPVLPPGSAPLTVLQLSDLHMTAGQRSKQEWVAGLADLRPDLVITTDHKRVHGDPLPWRELRDGMTAAGWLDLTNATGALTVAGTRIAFAGVD